MKFILPFKDCSKDTFDLVGGKCASLGALIQAGALVPDGFAVTTAAWRVMLEQNGMQARIEKELQKIDSSADPNLSDVAHKIRTLVDETPIPAIVNTAAREAWSEWTARQGQEIVPVAVRSSATAEDLPSASFAGLHDTMLWIRGIDEVLHHMRRCWSSLYTPRAIAYRLDNGFAHDKVLMAVGIQKMVEAKASGVAFSLNPTNGDRSKIAIDASFGLGEAVVSGRVTPDHFLVDKVIFEVVKRVISTKEIEHVFDPNIGAVIERAIESSRKDQPSLTTEEIIAIAKMAKWAEQQFGRPQDIEWAIAADAPGEKSAFFLQSRPETVWSRKPPAPVTTANSRGIAGMVSTLIRGVKVDSKS